jgi:tetratricopeptide (TPR) repeat protein
MALLFLLAAMVSGVPARAQDVGEALDARVEAISAELRALHTSVLGLIPLDSLDRLVRWVPGHRVISVLRALVDDPETNALVRAQAVHSLAEAHLSFGEVEASEALFLQWGYLSDWSIVGPFPNDGMSGFDTAYDPELRRDPADTFAGRVGTIEWRDVSHLARLGYLDLGQLAQPPGASVVYAATCLTVDHRTNARLWTSVDGAYRIWLNGELVAELDADLGGGAVREWWDVTLRRGRNELVVKTAGEGGPLGFVLRLTQRDGSPLQALFASAALGGDDVELSTGSEVAEVGSVLRTLDALILQGGDDLAMATDEALAGAAALLHRGRSRDPNEPWRRFLTENDVCRTGSPRTLLLCSYAQDQFWVQHASLSRAAEALQPDDPLRSWILYERARLSYRGVGASAVDETAELCEQILASDPSFVPAQLLLARIFESEEQPWRAHGLILDALDTAPDSPEVALEAQWGYRRVGEVTALLDVYRRQMRLMANRSSLYLNMVPTLMRAGETDEAMATLDRASRLLPTSIALRRLRADIQLSSNDADGAEATLLSLIADFPGSAGSWEELGRFYVRTARTDEAEAAFDQVLLIEPQNQELSQYLAQLRSEVAPFYADYVLGLDEVLALSLPAEMTEDRDYFYLVDQQVTLVHPNGLGTRFVQVAYQVQTRPGAERLREFSIQYTPDSEIVEVLSARIIKPDGTVQESFDRWEESLSQPWYGLYYDFRALVLQFEDLAAGDILELSYTLANVSAENMFDDYFGELWLIQGSQPKAFARYGVIHPPEMTLTFREPVLEHEHRVRDDELGRHHIYEVVSVPRIESEASMPGFSSVADYIHVSTFESWAEVSSWYWNLVEDQLVVSPEIESTVAELIDGLSTTEDRVQAIHEYVVRNTRYVGLEFGIHGYRPYRTTVSFSRRFGDCKDTASLMKVMLAIAGIDSHIALVRTRSLGAIEESPASLAVFNHAITYVPELDLFMDGTAGHSGLAELPSGDQGAYSLVILDGPGHTFGAIPYSSAEDNVFSYVFEVDLSEEGAPTRGTMRATGQYAPSIRVSYEAEENRLENFQLAINEDHPGARIESLEFTGLDDITRPIDIQFTFSGAVWARASGNRLMLSPLGIDPRLTARYASTATRRQVLVLRNPFTSTYSLRYTLPPDVTIEIENPSWTLESRFGRFQLDLAVLEGILLVNSYFQLSVSTVSVADYPAFREFIQSVERVLNQNLVLERHSDG